MQRILVYDPQGKLDGNFKSDGQIYIKNRAEDALVFLKTCAPSAVAVLTETEREKNERFIRSVKMSADVPVVAICIEEDALSFYNMGADAVFLGKKKELFLYETERLLRKRELSGDKMEIRQNDLFVSLSAYKCMVGEREIKMPRKEIEILFLLASSPDKVFSRDEILDEVWGVDYIGDPRTVDVHILRIRGKIKDSACKVKTISRAGYKFVAKEV